MVFELGVSAGVSFVDVLLLAVVMGFGAVMMVVLDCFVDDVGGGVGETGGCCGLVGVGVGVGGLGRLGGVRRRLMTIPAGNYY